MEKISKDFRGVKCPINFARTVMELSQMNKDEILEIFIDDGSPIQNVPNALKEEGHKVLKQEEEPTGGWKLTIQKG